LTQFVAFVDEADGAFGVAIPDAPGCTAMGESVDEAIANAALALREWMADRVAGGLEPPPARSVAALRSDPSLAEEFAEEPVLSLVPLLLDTGRMVSANISVDAGLLAAIDEAARSRGLTRSAFLASAARDKIASQR
jgi:predicted RNase H-like HicB family nuclease